MKLLMSALLVVCSVSAFADCNYDIRGSYKASRGLVAERVMSRNGFSTHRPDKVAYRLNMDTSCESYQEGSLCVVHASLSRLSDGKVVASGSRTQPRISAALQLNPMLRKILKSFPTCNELSTNP